MNARIRANLPVIFLSLALIFAASGCKKKQAGIPASAIQIGNFIILDTRTDQTDRARAKQNVEDAMIRYPDIDCLVGLWAYNGPAILSAVKNAGKVNKVKIVCFDEESDALQGIADGYIHGTVVQQPCEFGYQSVRILAALARGDKSLIPESKIIDIPVKIIGKDNVMAFWGNLKKQLAGTVDLGEKKTTAKTDSEKVNIAFVSNNPADFWKIAQAGVRKAEKEFNAKCQCNYKANKLQSKKKLCQLVFFEVYYQVMEKLTFNGIESKGWRISIKWKSHDICVELFREEDLSESHPPWYIFELHIDGISKDKRQCQGYIPHGWMGASPGLTYKLFENNEEILLEAYLSYHHLCPAKIPFSGKCVLYFGQFINLFKNSDDVYKYGAVLHIGNKVLYNSAKWAKYSKDYK